MSSLYFVCIIIKISDTDYHSSTWLLIKFLVTQCQLLHHCYKNCSKCQIAELLSKTWDFQWACQRTISRTRKAINARNMQKTFFAELLKNMYCVIRGIRSQASAAKLARLSSTSWYLRAKFYKIAFTHLHAHGVRFTNLADSCVHSACSQ